MNSIMNELYDDEKKHRSKTKLPSITQKRSANNTIDKWFFKNCPKATYLDIDKAFFYGSLVLLLDYYI